MAKRNIRWTRTADTQYVGILEYWVKRNKSATYSKKLIKSVANRTRQIAESPLIYKKADFNDTRVASLGNYSIFYKVTDQEIVITAFWDNRQNPKKLLKILYFGAEEINYQNILFFTQNPLSISLRSLIYR